ncbi:GerMN domain-containing protein [Candidatus Aminicenantes bacterium AC-335-A11]|jgi:germination protein M|nr:GerMN domain-containing protein [SCandidatus Aminicenantes bacterium Aminicenantia_JdfR_composite]MCP2597975.1 GerMN domain-containing protein [Candidatus Aminicenantes bacterium AC-335-L06]MCP2618179.1 GerMN domain-containing protein [Candidatus Aminicenantes bacterium AC-335-A11]
MKRKERILLISLFIIVCILIILIILSLKTEKIKVSREVTQTYFPNIEETTEKREVTIFFPSEEDSLLYPEAREIYLTPSLIQQAKQVILELIKGPENNHLPTLPPTTKLREIFITNDGTAYIDFSKEIYQQHPGGSEAEIISIYAIVNSLTYNFPQIKRVQILIEGLEKETLNGHIDLTKPFSPRFNLIASNKEP